jgi:hypothetical protein
VRANAQAPSNRSPPGDDEEKHGRRGGGDPSPAPPRAEDFLGRAPDDRFLDPCLSSRIRAEQRAIADRVQQARNTARQAVGRAHGLLGEDRLALARDLQPMLDVALRFFLAERSQVIAGGHALRELAQVPAREQLRQLGLADQHHLEQLLRRRLQIGQETHFF